MHTNMDLIVTTLKKQKDNLYNQVLEIRKEVEQAETVRICIEEILQENGELTQVKKQELDLQRWYSIIEKFELSR